MPKAECYRSRLIWESTAVAPDRSSYNRANHPVSTIHHALPAFTDFILADETILGSAGIPCETDIQSLRSLCELTVIGKPPRHWNTVWAERTYSACDSLAVMGVWVKSSRLLVSLNSCRALWRLSQWQYMIKAIFEAYKTQFSQSLTSASYSWCLLNSRHSDTCSLQCSGTWV